jgi:hypothetical protein
VLGNLLDPENVSLALAARRCDRTQDFFRGTLAPFFRASDRPMAIACLRLLTRPPFPPLPDFKVPCFLRRMALLTLFPAAFPYCGIRILPAKIKIVLVC